MNKTLMERRRNTVRDHRNFNNKEKLLSTPPGSQKIKI